MTDQQHRIAAADLRPGDRITAAGITLVVDTCRIDFVGPTAATATITANTGLQIRTLSAPAMTEAQLELTLSGHTEIEVTR